MGHLRGAPVPGCNPIPNYSDGRARCERGKRSGDVQETESQILRSTKPKDRLRISIFPFLTEVNLGHGNIYPESREVGCPGDHSVFPADTSFSPHRTWAHWSLPISLPRPLPKHLKAVLLEANRAKVILICSEPTQQVPCERPKYRREGTEKPAFNASSNEQKGKRLVPDLTKSSHGV